MSTSHHVFSRRIALLCCLVITAECSLSSSLRAQEAGDSTTAGIAYFEKHVRPLLVERCYECHSGRSSRTEGGLALDNPASWLKGGDSGSTIVPGDPESSLLIRAVRHSSPDLQMPPKEKLSEDEIQHLVNWVQLGAPAPEEDPASTVPHPSDPVAGKSHWAFQPLLEAKVPDVRNVDWARSDIDRFVLARLEQQSLTPVEDASPADLIRRITMVITGLPPSPEHLVQYQSQPTTETLSRIVDELLASPQFGQRWGRHWLDLARYADSNGLDENFLFREAWRYRNWVIDAINADMPYDRFLLEQLAGDLLPYESIEQRDRQRIAAGFLVVGPKVLLGVNPDRQKMDVADEQIETVGRVVLGQTLGCARCHDHKFDPVPARDYYALAGIFTSTRVMEQRFMLNEQRVMERLEGLGPDGSVVDDAYETFYRELPNLRAHGEKSKAVLDLLKQKNEQAIAERLTQDGDGFCDQARDASIPIDQRIEAQEKYLATQIEKLTKPPGIPPRAMIPCEADAVHDEAIRKSGKFDRLGDVVPRGFLTVLLDGEPKPLPEKQSGRIELAQWLTNTQTRSGALAARVQANRIWYHVMGRGLVRTVDNFGRTGEAPSHPELLDHLATLLMRENWSLKAMIRHLVLSRTFALSSQSNLTNSAVDPDNALLWRANRRRLDAESLRDAMLQAAGVLEPEPVDSTVAYLGDQATAVGNNAVRRRTDYNFRSVYLPVIRNDLPELFEVFDFANPHFATGARPQTNVPTQGLFLLNDAMVMTAARTTAHRIIDESRDTSLDRRINRMFELILSKTPDEEERRTIAAFLEQTAYRLNEAGDPEPELTALARACHALFVSSRFLFLE